MKKLALIITLTYGFTTYTMEKLAAHITTLRNMYVGNAKIVMNYSKNDATTVAHVDHPERGTFYVQITGENKLTMLTEHSYKEHAQHENYKDKLDFHTDDVKSESPYQNLRCYNSYRG